MKIEERVGRTILFSLTPGARIVKNGFIDFKAIYVVAEDVPSQYE